MFHLPLPAKRGLELFGKQREESAKGGGPLRAELVGTSESLGWGEGSIPFSTLNFLAKAGHCIPLFSAPSAPVRGAMSPKSLGARVACRAVASERRLVPTRSTLARPSNVGFQDYGSFRTILKGLKSFSPALARQRLRWVNDKIEFINSERVESHIRIAHRTP
jgi:hypothetical protein